MRSKVAADVSRKRREQLAAMSPAERIALAAGGFLDLRDAAALLEVGPRATVEAEVESRLVEVRPDIRAAWRDLLARLP